MPERDEWEYWEDLTEELYSEKELQKGGGGSKKKKKEKPEAHKIAVEQSREKRLAEVTSKIKEVLDNFPSFENKDQEDRFIGNYLSFVTSNIDAPEISFEDKDLSESFSRSGGPGGQNVNKVSTAVNLVHLTTGITVHSRDQREQLKNRNEANKKLRKRLREHLDDWKIYLNLSNNQTVTADLIFNIKLAD